MDDVYKRSWETTAKIHEAFFLLLSQKPYHKIMVKELAEEIGISRQTFYYYYSSKDVLLDEIIDYLASGLIELMKESGEAGLDQIVEWLSEPFHPSFVKYFAYMRHNYEQFKLLISSDVATNFLVRFKSRINDFQQMRLDYFKRFIDAESHAFYKAMYESVMGDLVNGLIQWVYNEMVPDEAVMATHHTRMWVSAILLSKDTGGNYIRVKLQEKLNEKGISL